MVTTELRVRYAETDAMGVAHHSNIFIWFELGRSDWMRSRGLPYPELEARGVLAPVVATEARFHAPARYDELLVIETRAEDLTPVKTIFSYRVLRDGRLLAEGRTVHAFINLSGRPVALPKKLPEVWEMLAGAVEQERSGAL